MVSAKAFSPKQELQQTEHGSKEGNRVLCTS